MDQQSAHNQYYWLLVSTETPPGVNLRRRSLRQGCVMSSLHQQTPGGLVLITLQSGVDDGAGSPPDHHFLPGLHLITQVGQASLGVHLKLFLRGPTRDQEAGSRKQETGSRNRTERVNNLRTEFNFNKQDKTKRSKQTKAEFVLLPFWRPVYQS